MACFVMHMHIYYVHDYMILRMLNDIFRLCRYMFTLFAKHVSSVFYDICTFDLTRSPLSEPVG